MRKAAALFTSVLILAYSNNSLAQEADFDLTNTDLTRPFIPVIEYKNNRISEVFVYSKLKDTATLIEHSYYDKNGYVTQKKKCYGFSDIFEDSVIITNKDYQQFTVTRFTSKSTLLSVKDKRDVWWPYHEILFKLKDFLEPGKDSIVLKEVYTITDYKDSIMNRKTYLNGKDYDSGTWRMTLNYHPGPEQKEDTTIESGIQVITTRNGRFYKTIEKKYYIDNILIQQEDIPEDTLQQSAMFTTDYLYDKKSRLISVSTVHRVTNTNQPNKYWSGVLYSYGKDKAHTIFKDLSNTKIERYILRYNEAGLLFEHTQYLPGYGTCMLQYDYFKNGLMQEKRVYENGELIHKYIYAYRFRK